MKILQEVRAAKTKKELSYIIKAQRLSEQVLSNVIQNLKPKVTEIEIANLIKREFRRKGISILSFPPIVAFGPNTSNVHHVPGKSKLKSGDIVMLDFGATVNHYCSDMTRTFFAGVPTQRQKKVYLDVLRAEEMTIRKIARGERRTWVIDRAARNFLNKKHGAKKFPHGLGHGIGTVIHEWPNFKPKSEDVLPEGCVMTVEPGLYFKNWGGVRIEDMVLITKKSFKNLTNFPKSLKDVILPRWRKGS